MTLSDYDLNKLEKKGYRFLGSRNHAAAKICHWTKKSLIDEGICYKEKFYGIKSHRCLQMSPSIPYCHHKCVFCWRDVSITRTEWEKDYDEPEKIIDDCIKAQRNLLVGYFGNDRANRQKLLDAQNPTNAAISLAGEPLLYPSIQELLDEFEKRNFTTFLVTNGLEPVKLEKISLEPTQLYISLDAPNQKIYQKVCKPQVENGWSKLNQSLDLLANFNCRTVLRITCVQGYNMSQEHEYASIIDKSNPDFVEIKAYMYVGSSRQRLDLNNMPHYEDVRRFAEKVAYLSQRKIVNESPESRVVLLA
jgi:tRNA wybutosine-synthesizing protein 1